MPVGPYTQIISDEIFTDRREFLDRWFQRILGTPRLAMMSHAFIGRRRWSQRTGKCRWEWARWSIS